MVMSELPTTNPVQRTGHAIAGFLKVHGETTCKTPRATIQRFKKSQTHTYAIKKKTNSDSLRGYSIFLWRRVELSEYNTHHLASGIPSAIYSGRDHRHGRARERDGEDDETGDSKNLLLDLGQNAGGYVSARNRDNGSTYRTYSWSRKRVYSSSPTLIAFPPNCANHVRKLHLRKDITAKTPLFILA
jgi:hypothetical protein